MRRWVILATALSLAACAGPSPEKSATATGEYERRLSRLQEQPSDYDFTALRRAYARSSKHRPYTGAELASDAMLKALNQGRHRAALATARRILAENYTSLNAHYAAEIAFRRQGEVERARFHGWVLDGLMQSVAASGDGRNPETAFVVTGPHEMRAFLGIQGLEIRGQGTVERPGGQEFHRVKVRDSRSNRVFTVHFRMMGSGPRG